jgi:hypothetical protein
MLSSLAQGTHFRQDPHKSMNDIERSPGSENLLSYLSSSNLLALTNSLIPDDLVIVIYRSGALLYNRKSFRLLTPGVKRSARRRHDFPVRWFQGLTRKNSLP